MSSDADRITVSRGELRAELRAGLAEMELRLMRKIDERIDSKADTVPVAMLSAKVEAIERGEFVDPLRRALADFVEDAAKTRVGQAWTRRERVMGVVGTVLFLAGFCMSVVINLINLRVL
jgi:hypothetical protein